MPGVPTGTLDASPNARHPRAGIVCPSPSALIDARQTRLQAVPDLSSLSRVPISPVSVRTASPSPHYPIRNYIHPSHYMHRAPEQTAVSASFDRRHAYLSDRRVPRRSSTGVYGSYHPNSCDPSHARHHSRQIDHAYHIQDYPSRLDQRFGPSDERFSPDFALGTCESVQPSFFTPSAYEYQHGKVRKRSNLPKQSTEIMKTWFDQVCAIQQCMVITERTLIEARTSRIPILAKIKRLSSPVYVCRLASLHTTFADDVPRSRALA